MNDKLNGLISREDYDGMDANQRDWLQFNYLIKIDKRTTLLERRKKFDSIVSGTTGLIGGFAGFLTMAKLKLFGP